MADYGTGARAPDRLDRAPVRADDRRGRHRRRPERQEVKMQYEATVAAPFAVLGIRSERGRLVELAYLPTGTTIIAPRNAIAERVVRELERYLDDADFRFAVPLDPAGTAFRQRVWAHLNTIP